MCLIGSFDCVKLVLQEQSNMEFLSVVLLGGLLSGCRHEYVLSACPSLYCLAKQ